MDTCVLQWDPRESEYIAAAFMAMVHTMVIDPRRDPDYIINMDHSPIPFTFDMLSTL
jgi:hypothetical protein